MNDRKELARRLVRESAVLLKNEEGTLPLKEGSCAALFGRAQFDTFVSGNGSGAAHRKGCKNILTACEEQGLVPETGLSRFYRDIREKEGEKDPDAFDWSMAGQYINSGVMYEIFGKYHPPKEEPDVPEEILSCAVQRTDAAVWILGRNSGGEECDRHLEGDYFLTDSERRLAERICTSFSKVILVLNVNGLVDLSWTERYDSLKAILFLGIPGEEGAEAFAQLLLGKASPCGKLAVTIAQAYEDYPAAADFTWDKEDAARLLTYESYGLDAEENGSRGFAKSPVTLYREGIYLGYRYFSSFGKKPLFAFGHGLSYTDFGVSVMDVERMPQKAVLTVSVENTGTMPGKETVQVYVSVDCAVERERLALIGWEKTGLLAPGEKEILRIEVCRERFACYDEGQAAWVIPTGNYVLWAGTSSEKRKQIAAFIVVEQEVLTQCENRLGLRECNRGKVPFLRQQDRKTGGADRRLINDRERAAFMRTKSMSLEDRTGAEEEECIDSLLHSLSVEELACLCVGYGPGVPFSAFGEGTEPSTLFDETGKPLTQNDHPTGFAGYVSPAIPEKGIHSVFYKDGPAGIGQFAWPSEMLLACSFDRKLWYAFGEAVGRECESEQVDVWLAPAMNLIRHPLGGRNFEYFSEDPFLTGSCGCEITRGVQENHKVLVCAKHFAANEQETWRRGNAKRQYDAVDSIVEERPLRELYLRPFEMLVREAGLSCIMTSFNKINGTFAAGNAALCTKILREEWGFDGVAVTDWGDMDIVADGADAIHAGNDIVMPGGPPVIRQILQGYRENRVTKADLERSVRRLLHSFGSGAKQRREESAANEKADV